jgi:hypothetical protein
VGGHRPQKFLHPANYIYFDLIVSYLIILTTKFVKLPILWSQISPCRPRKQVLLNFFLGLSGRCHQAPAKATSSTPQIFIHPERKYENPSLGERRGGGGVFLIYTKNLFARLILFKYATSGTVIFSQIS